MNPFLGFVLVTHKDPEQIEHLCHSLARRFPAAPIALHHDFSQCAIRIESLPAHVHVVEEWVATSWGKISVVEAFIAGTRQLQRLCNPDWYISISGADYPIRSARDIEKDLRNATCDVFLDHHPLLNHPLPTDHKRDFAIGFSDPEWARLGYERYVALRPLPWRIMLRWPFLQAFTFRGRVAEWFSPFSKQVRPYGGDNWFTFNRKAAQAFVQESSLLKRLLIHYRRRGIPEESLHHSLLCNWPDLKIENNNLRYVDWSQGGAHPKFLGFEDIPAMLASGDHFARKFKYEPALYAAIDEATELAGESAFNSRG